MPKTEYEEVLLKFSQLHKAVDEQVCSFSNEQEALKQENYLLRDRVAFLEFLLLKNSYHTPTFIRDTATQLLTGYFENSALTGYFRERLPKNKPDLPFFGDCDHQ